MGRESKALSDDAYGDWDSLLPSQLADLTGPGLTEDELAARSLAAGLILGAVFAFNDMGEKGRHARAWVDECSLSEGGFGWWAGLIGIPPLKLRAAILEMADEENNGGS